MKKTKNIVIMIVILVSILIVVGLSVILLDTTGIINQGSYRVNDAILISTITVEEEDLVLDEATGLSDMILNVSQNNKISMLITKDVEAKRAYVDNISFNSKQSNNIVVYQTGYDKQISNKELSKEIEIYLEDKENQYFVELNIDNLNVIKNVEIPDNINSITFDGKLLPLIGKSIKDVEFNIKFNLNIIDSLGKKNVCRISLKLPKEELLTTGVSITREDTKSFIFSTR